MLQLCNIQKQQIISIFGFNSHIIFPNIHVLISREYIVTNYGNNTQGIIYAYILDNKHKLVVSTVKIHPLFQN